MARVLHGALKWRTRKHGFHTGGHGFGVCRGLKRRVVRGEQVAERLQMTGRQTSGMSVGAWIHVMGTHANSLLARELAARPRARMAARPHTSHGPPSECRCAHGDESRSIGN
eukprot:3108112-Pyramimonas_sp.AAC.1